MLRNFAIICSLLVVTYSSAITQNHDAMGDEAWDVLQEFFEYDKTIPLDSKIIFTRELPECILYKFVFTSIRNKRVPGYLAVPKTGNAPYPLIVGCHGGYGSKDNFWNIILKHNFAGPILSEGYAILILDAVYHGERSADNDFENIRNILSEKLKYSFSDLIVNTAIDYRRALDYMSVRPDINMDKIGVFGHSMGGIMTFFLTAVDSRIKVSVPCVSPPTYNTMSYPTNLVHYAARFNNQPTLMLMGTADPTYTKEAAEHLYENINSKTKDIFWFESGHSLPPEWSANAIKWFTTYLK